MSAALSKTKLIGAGRIVNTTRNVAQSIQEMIDVRIVPSLRLNNPTAFFSNDFPDKVDHNLIGTVHLGLLPEELQTAYK